jgi:glycosyltransferase involved in cell wall biosynthesis
VDAPHYSWREQVILLGAILKARVDCMHFTHFNAPLLYRRPSVVTIHDLTLSFYPGKKMTSSLHRWAYRTTINAITSRARKIISVSEYTKKDLVHVLGVDEDRVSVIYHGIDRERFQSVFDPKEDARLLQQHYDLKNPYFLYSGVWREHKNLPRLIEAFSQFTIKTGNQDMLLVIAGKEDPSYHEVRDTIIRCNLRDRVRILGFVEEAMLPVVFRNALAFTFPSLYEGFGLPVLEAMGTGVPVVCSQTTSLPEVAGRENALFFDPLSIDDIAEKLTQIVSNASLRASLIAR